MPGAACVDGLIGKPVQCGDRFGTESFEVVDVEIHFTPFQFPAVPNVEVSDDAVEIDPWSSVIWNNRGLCLSKLGYDDEAILCFDNAIKLDPQNDVAWNNAGLKLDRRDRYEESVISSAMMVQKFSPQMGY